MNKAEAVTPTLDVELRALSDRATPGPWAVSAMRGKRDGYVKSGDKTVADCRYKNGEADAVLIVAAVNYVRAALSATPAEDGPE